MILNVVEKSGSSYQIRAHCWCPGFLLVNKDWIFDKYISIEPATLQCRKSLKQRFINEKIDYIPKEHRVITRLVTEGILKL